MIWLAAVFGSGRNGAGDGKAVPGFVPWIFAVADSGIGGERRRRNPKRMGEVSQAAFLLRAWTLGFGLTLPWGDRERYDFVVWAGRADGCCGCRLRGLAG